MITLCPIKFGYVWPFWKHQDTLSLQLTDKVIMSAYLRYSGIIELCILVKSNMIFRHGLREFSRVFCRLQEEQMTLSFIHHVFKRHSSCICPCRGGSRISIGEDPWVNNCMQSVRKIFGHASLIETMPTSLPRMRKTAGELHETRLFTPTNRFFYHVCM